MRSSEGLLDQVDWLTLGLYFLMVTLGWLNIYAATYDEASSTGIFDFANNSGKQLLWILGSIGLIVAIFVLDFRFYDSFSYLFYGVFVILLVLVLFTGTVVAGSRSWFQFAGLSFQPSELMKFGCALALARFMSHSNFNFRNIKNAFFAFVFFTIPSLLVIIQGDTGTALVFASFVFVLYREGLHPAFLMTGFFVVILFVLTLLISQVWLIIMIVTLGLTWIALSIRNIRTVIVVSIGLLLSIAFTVSVEFILTDVLKPHQRSRVLTLVNPDIDPLGYGWNVTQSKIAIGSGGVFGKGFLNGTQTKFDFVPEQSTDFIFCTIGEEHGWIGSIFIVFLFTLLIMRIIVLAERQKSNFSRIYGYGVASIFLFHFTINIGMTIGLFPVIGIPLPFFSYGGSSLWSFTILLFVFLKLDAHRMQVLMRP